MKVLKGFKIYMEEQGVSENENPVLYKQLERTYMVGFCECYYQIISSLEMDNKEAKKHLDLILEDISRYAIINQKLHREN